MKVMNLNKAQVLISFHPPFHPRPSNERKSVECFQQIILCENFIIKACHSRSPEKKKAILEQFPINVIQIFAILYFPPRMKLFSKQEIMNFE